MFGLFSFCSDADTEGGIGESCLSIGIGIVQADCFKVEEVVSWVGIETESIFSRVGSATGEKKSVPTGKGRLDFTGLLQNPRLSNSISTLHATHPILLHQSSPVQHAYSS